MLAAGLPIATPNFFVRKIGQQRRGFRIILSFAATTTRMASSDSSSSSSSSSSGDEQGLDRSKNPPSKEAAIRKRLADLEKGEEIFFHHPSSFVFTNYFSDL